MAYLREELKKNIEEVLSGYTIENPIAISEKIERVCYNRTLESAKDSGIKLSWDVQELVELYKSHMRSLLEVLQQQTIIDHIIREPDEIYKVIKLYLYADSSIDDIQETPKICPTPTTTADPAEVTVKKDNPHRAAFKECLNRVFAQNQLDELAYMTDIIEKSCYNYAITKSYEDDIIPSWINGDFCHKYHFITYNILSNIDPASTVRSTYLLDKLKLGEINPADIVKMQTHELAPQNSEYERNYISTQLKQKIEEKTSVLFYCKKCGERKTTYREAQTRSLDEPTTIFVTCVNCGNRWIC